YSAGKDVESRFGVSIPGIDFDERQTQVSMRLDQSQVEYHEQLFSERDDLFTELVGEFVSYAEEQGFTPAFVMVGQLRYAKYEVEHGPVYGDLMERLNEEFSDLVTIDMARRLETDDIESLYVNHGEGGHYSPETNERIARILREEVFEQSG
ncbi:MAG TPA: hypothetical protein VFJ06_03905, partial [Halococcus sp.]|nr:hypothetical protein [Halococcus sp.]